MLLALLLVWSCSVSSAEESVASALDNELNNTNSSLIEQNIPVLKDNEEHEPTTSNSESENVDSTVTEHNIANNAENLDNNSNISGSTTDEPSSVTPEADGSNEESTSTTTDADGSNEESTSANESNVSVSITDNSSIVTTNTDGSNEESTSANESNVSVSTTENSSIVTTGTDGSNEDSASDNEANISVSTTATPITVTIEADQEGGNSDKDANISDSTNVKNGIVNTETGDNSQGSTSDNESNISLVTTDESSTVTAQPNDQSKGSNEESTSGSQLNISDYSITNRAKRPVVNTRKSIARYANKFGDDLYRKLAKKKGNILFAPYSIHTVLCMLALGASRATRAELLTRLYFKDITELKQAYLNESMKRDSQNDQKLRIANNIFYDKKMPLLQSFTAIAERIFEATPTEVDFQQPTQAEEHINNWVANQTNQAIPNLLEKNSLNDNILVMLVNAMYFKGEWQTKFDKSLTIKNHNFQSAKRKIKCDMMVMNKNVQRFYNGPNFRILVLPFSETGTNIAFILPPFYDVKGNRPNLAKTDALLNDKTFFEAIKNLQSKEIQIKIPKFKLSKSLSLGDNLISLGLKKIFGNADFANLFLTESPVTVSEVLQTTVVEINENGTTAAAASSAGIKGRTMRASFVLNVPFLFVLYDSYSEIILIRGRVVDPTGRI